MKLKKIYLSGIRTPSNNDFIILRSYEKAVREI